MQTAKVLKVAGISVAVDPVYEMAVARVRRYVKPDKVYGEAMVRLFQEFFDQCVALN